VTQIPNPPQAEQEERAVLGAMLVSSKACALALSHAGLRPEHFGSERNRAIFAACAHLVATHESVDAITVSTELRKGPAIGGAGSDYLMELGNNAPLSTNVPTYAKAILDAADLRAKLTGARFILEGVGEQDRGKIQRGIEEATAQIRQAAEPVTADELASEFLAELESGQEGVAFKMPWKRMNSTLLGGGLYPGDVTVLLGWSGHGKTTMLDQVFAGVREQGYRTMLFDTEMPRRQRMARFVSRVTGIPYAHVMLRQGLTESARSEIFQAMNRLPFDYHREAESWTVEEICQELTIRNVDVAAIDTLQAIHYKDEAQLREMTRHFRAAAKATNTHLFLVSHMNMARAKDAVRPAPSKRDILGSGSIEQAASNIIAVHRDQEKDGTLKETGELIVLKSRHGLEGKVKVKLIPGGYGFEQKRPATKQTELGVAVADEEPLGD
jgi:replicative DNA helicase